MKRHIQNPNDVLEDTPDAVSNTNLGSLTGPLTYSTLREGYRSQVSPYQTSQLDSSYNDGPSENVCDPFMQTFVPESNIDISPTRKRKRSDFEVYENTGLVDVVSKGLISVEEALQYFQA